MNPMSLLARIRCAARPQNKRVIDVGWLMRVGQAAFIWDPPALYRREGRLPEHAKSAAYCPAVVDYERRFVQINCPFDLRLRAVIKDSGEAVLEDADGIRSGMMPHALVKLAKMAPRIEWRHPDRPIFQFRTPYIFLADTPVYLSQLPPFNDYRDPPWPGLLIGGRLPIHVWPRSLNWAFEWYDVGKELILKRGQPWFYCRFETTDPSLNIRLVEAEYTADLRTYLAGIDGVVEYVNGTFSLFSAARQRRPERLLIPATARRAAPVIE